MPMLRQMGFSIPRLLGYMSEQAIYMVNSFQFTRSARLSLVCQRRKEVSRISDISDHLRENQYTSSV